MTDNLPLRAALALGITSSSIFAGVNFSLAYVSTPSLLNTPVPISTGALLTQWQQHYNIAKAYCLPLVVTTVLPYAFGVYTLHHKTLRGQLLAAGAAAMIIGAPIFSVLFMEGPLGNVNGILGSLNKEVNARSTPTVGESEEREVRGLLEHWAVMVTIRCIGPMIASVAGIWASFEA